MLADSVCGSSCTDFNESFDRVLNELDFLKNKVQNLEVENQSAKIELEYFEAQNLILENKIENLEQKSVFPVPATCEEYRELGIHADGEYKIQPSRELEPFTVKCEFNETVAITVIEKEHENKEHSLFINL